MSKKDKDGKKRMRPREWWELIRKEWNNAYNQKLKDEARKFAGRARETRD